MKKQILLLILMLLPLAASADECGSCGDNVTYSFEEATGTLTISGTGAMNNYNYYYDAPWYFYKENILKAIITDGVTSIGAYAFRGCSGLTSVTIGNSVTSIGMYAFYGCSGLTSLTIPNSVTSINNEAFRGCSGLTSITVESGNSVYDSQENCNAIIETSTNTLIAGCKNTVIPNSVTSIGHHAFEGCSGLTSVTIPNSVTSIGSDAFYSCSSLTSITVESGNTVYDSRKNCNAIIKTSTNTLIRGCENTIIPNSVTSIGSGAFADCSGLTSVTIPNSVTTIGSAAFGYCSGLTSVTIPNSVTTIGSAAFGYCSGLTSVTIPNSVTSIGDNAFNSCSGLTSVTIGSGIEIIYSSAFAYCPELTDVYCYAENVPSTSSNAFDGSLIEYATLHVPTASIDAYKAVEPWKSFKTIMGLDGTLPETPKCATPTISYGGKKLMYVCDTEDVEFVTEIKDADIGTFHADKITLSATYEISVYATKAGYENSDKATATLVWANATFTNTTPATAISPVEEMAPMPVLIQSNSGTVTIQGAADGTNVSIYTTAGTQAGSAVSQNGHAAINTSLQAGSIAIIKIGSQSVKYVVK